MRRREFKRGQGTHRPKATDDNDDDDRHHHHRYHDDDKLRDELSKFPNYANLTTHRLY